MCWHCRRHCNFSQSPNDGVRGSRQPQKSEFTCFNNPTRSDSSEYFGHHPAEQQVQPGRFNWRVKKFCQNLCAQFWSLTGSVLCKALMQCVYLKLIYFTVFVAKPLTNAIGCIHWQCVKTLAAVCFGAPLFGPRWNLHQTFSFKIIKLALTAQRGRNGQGWSPTLKKCT